MRALSGLCCTVLLSIVAVKSTPAEKTSAPTFARPETRGVFDATIEPAKQHEHDTNGLLDTLPDLTVSSVDATGATQNIQTLEINGEVTARVANSEATDAAGPFSVLLFEDRNHNGAFDPGTDNVLGDASVPMLAADSTTTIPIPVSGRLLFRQNLIYAFVDSDDVVAESREGNNYGNTGAGCKAEPMPGAFNPTVEWAWTRSSVLPNSLNIMMTPAIIDLNGDTVPDVVFGSTASTGGGYVEERALLRALSGSDGAELFSVTDPALALNAAASVAGRGHRQRRPTRDPRLDCLGGTPNCLRKRRDIKWLTTSTRVHLLGCPLHCGPEQGRDTGNRRSAARRSNNNGKDPLDRDRGTRRPGGPLSLVSDVDPDGTPKVVAGNTVYSPDGAKWQDLALPDGYNAVGNLRPLPYPKIVLVSGGTIWLLEHDLFRSVGAREHTGRRSGRPPDGGRLRRRRAYRRSGSRARAPTRSSRRTARSSGRRYPGHSSRHRVLGVRLRRGRRGGGRLPDELYLPVYRGADGAVLFQTPISSCTWHEYPARRRRGRRRQRGDRGGRQQQLRLRAATRRLRVRRRRDTGSRRAQIWNQHTYHITNVRDGGRSRSSRGGNWLSPPASPTTTSARTCGPDCLCHRSPRPI